MLALAVFLGAAGACAGTLWWAAGVLPERVPTHFGPSLQADDYGSRGELVWTMGLVGLFVLVTFGGLWLVARKRPLRIMNIPHKDHWVASEHEPEFRRRLAIDMANMGTATLLLVTAIMALTVRAADSEPVRLSPLAWVVVGAYLTFILAWCAWMALRRYRPPSV